MLLARLKQRINNWWKLQIVKRLTPANNVFVVHINLNQGRFTLLPPPPLCMGDESLEVV